MAGDPRYDIVLTDGQNRYGYMLARGEALGRGARSWQVESAGASLVQRSPTEQQYGNQPAPIETPVVFRTWHRGYGDERQLQEGRYHYALNADARFPAQILPGPYVHLIAPPTLPVGVTADPITAIFEQDGFLFVLAGRYCYYLDGADLEIANDFGAGETALSATVFGGNAYIGMGYTEPFWERASGPNPAAGWTQAGAGLYIGYSASFKDRMWASVSESTVRAVAADPMTGADWTAEYAIGDATHTITSLAELNDMLYVGKTDGLYALDQEGQGKQLTPELKGAISANNCVNMVGWQGMLWVPHVRGLFQYQSMGAQGYQVAPGTPGAFVPDANPVRGRITALAGDNRWLYATLYTQGGNSYLLAGRRAFQDEPELLTWHPLAALSSTWCRTMKLSGLWTSPRLLFGAGTSLAYIVLPQDGENPLQDSNCRYATSGSIYFPAHDCYAPSTWKVWKSIEVCGSGFTQQRYVDVYYRMDGGVWRLAGRVTRGPRFVLALPVMGVAGIEVEVRLDFTLPSSSVPCIVEKVALRAAERPSVVKVVTAAIRCSDGLPLRNGSRERRSGTQILQELEELVVLPRAVLLTDTIGHERWVLPLAPLRESELAQFGNETPERVAMLSMAIFEAEATVDTGVDIAVYGESKYDDGSVYGP